MPTEADLRDLLHDDGSEPGALDSADIIRRAKARRRPKRIVAGVVGGVAGVGALALVLPLTLGIGGAGLSAAGGSAADEAGAGDDASTLKSDAEESSSALSVPIFPVCGAPLTEAAPDPDGLVLRVAPVGAHAGAERITTTVTLTNEGDTEVAGITGMSARLTFAGDGKVLWFDNEPHFLVGMGLDLQPGESKSFPATFRPVVCDPSDDVRTAEGFPPDLPSAPPGDYTLTATLDLVSPGDGTGENTNRQITGPATAISLQ